MTEYELTPKQKQAFNKLKKAFSECYRLGLYIWDDYGTIAAVNGRKIALVCPDPVYDEELEEDYVSYFSPKCWHGSNADDTLYIERKRRGGIKHGRD